jgi:putative flippase GtrA
MFTSIKLVCRKYFKINLNPSENTLANVWQQLRFVMVGLVNTAVGLSIIYGFMYFFNAGPGVANSLGYSAGLIVSFFLNGAWTFGAKNRSVYTIMKFVVVAAISYISNLIVVLIASKVFLVNPYIAQILGIPPYTVIMYLGCRKFVFKSDDNF